MRCAEAEGRNPTRLWPAPRPQTAGPVLRSWSLPAAPITMDQGLRPTPQPDVRGLVLVAKAPAPGFPAALSIYLTILISTLASPSSRLAI